MRARYNTKGVKDGSDFEPIPAGRYTVKVERVKETNKEGVVFKTKDGDPMVYVFLIVTSGKYKGTSLFHRVAFFPKDHRAAGFTKHFLKVLGENYNPQTEEFDFDTDRWPSLNEFFADVSIQEYPKGSGRLANAVDGVDYLNKEVKQESSDMQNVVF